MNDLPEKGARLKIDFGFLMVVQGVLCMQIARWTVLSQREGCLSWAGSACNRSAARLSLPPLPSVCVFVSQACLA